MTTKYIPVSRLTLSRMLGTFTPGYIDLMSRNCTMTSTKVVMSEGTDGSVLGKGVRKNNELLTKRESEGYLSDYPISSSTSKT